MLASWDACSESGQARPGLRRSHRAGTSTVPYHGGGEGNCQTQVIAVCLMVT